MTKPIDYIARAAMCRGRLISAKSIMEILADHLSKGTPRSTATAIKMLEQHVKALGEFLLTLDQEDAKKLYEYSLECERECVQFVEWKQ